jgi:hypothetical protein
MTLAALLRAEDHGKASGYRSDYPLAEKMAVSSSGGTTSS